MFELRSVKYPTVNFQEVPTQIQMKLEIGNTLELLFKNSGNGSNELSTDMLLSDLMSINLKGNSQKFNFLNIKQGFLIKGSNWIDDNDFTEFFPINEIYKVYALSIVERVFFMQKSNSQKNLYFWNEKKQAFVHTDKKKELTTNAINVSNVEEVFFYRARQTS